uniref:Uncharacterized protein n=1 Tax=Nelumbo nucifera TaxID=4432 RepID=A0A822YTK4_NELNU|nr:TPA_asm: hypothetical protein HUJ06_005095 [Nelumbo nucifera]
MNVEMFKRVLCSGGRGGGMVDAALIVDHIVNMYCGESVKKPSLHNFRCNSSLSGKYEPRGKGLNVQSTGRVG